MRLLLSGELQSGRHYIQLPVVETEREVCPKPFPQAAAYSIFVCAYIRTRGWQWLELLCSTYRIQPAYVTGNYLNGLKLVCASQGTLSLLKHNRFLLFKVIIAVYLKQ